jgi:hypothetical protein
MTAVLTICLVPAAGALGMDALPAASADPAKCQATAARDGIVDAIAAEGERYWNDGAALVSAPLHWETADWKKAAGFGLVLGGLFATDEHLNHESQVHRDAQTDSVSNFVQPMGGAGAVAISIALVGGGLLTGNSTTLESGREAIEASVLTGLLTNLVFKPVFGRERPNISNGRTKFEPFSRNYSFPSGDSTEAFSVASVIAIRSQGWVIPTIAYTTATLVALERVNRNVHFPSDVFAGAILGAATGRFLVARHNRETLDEPSAMSIDVAPTGRGLAIVVKF